MSVLEVFLAIGLGITLLTAVMTLINVPILKRRLGQPGKVSGCTVSVCIPARNEADNIVQVVESVLAQTLPEGVKLEVLLYDDESEDGTAELIAGLIQRDPRVRTVATHPMENGWSGKMWACEQLGSVATGDWILFIDADVRLTKQAIARTLEAAEGKEDLGLLSCFPEQQTETIAERLIVPMIHFILLSYLPFPRMRMSTSPSASAGCGQYLFVRTQDYREAGQHTSIRNTMHDGIKLTRAVRRLGRHTDLIDGLGVARCRMYNGFSACWDGFTKNAYEGLGSVPLLLFLTFMHLVGHVFPWVYLLISIVLGDLSQPATTFAGLAVIVSITQRTILAMAFNQPWTGVLLHPVGVSLMTTIQWASFAKQARGKRTWRGRTLGAEA
ncbi:MAG: glycosyltransferase [Planctomycetota bacterium]